MHSNPDNGSLTPPLSCPLCQQPLEPNQTLQSSSTDTRPKSWVCCNGHSFDEAKQGYLNLLPVQHKRSRHPGDDKAMVQARQQFLNAGYYQPLAIRLTQLLTEHLNNTKPTSPCDPNTLKLLDAGCGDGYYSEHITQGLQPHYNNLIAYGIDISKPAILAASKRATPIQWLVASLNNIPIPADSFDLIISIFSPLQNAMFQRCLKSTGILAVVSPASEHLAELKAQLYDTVKPFDANKIQQQLEQNWQLLHQEPLRFTLNLPDQTSIAALLAMTPHSWRIAPERKARVAQLNHLCCNTDFIISLWQKRP